MKRSDIKKFSELPNVGVVIEKDFFALGMHKPIELIGKDPYQMYRELCTITQRRHDPCVIDVFISAVRYMEGGPPKKWWEFTDERKKNILFSNQLKPGAAADAETSEAERRR